MSGQSESVPSTNTISHKVQKTQFV